ncbi:glycosyltransferase family A protein [uncultured Pseudokineococcus sp.]|uniref:glycosyltransferase family A protein n=1 Tax=uncultured Pseudokineococcus sp. TaxID=1642928 RepID=UPI0026253658|nr:glycosyltransferase family A protein [uncultured Pseudokineococcus sp.]
MDQQHVTATGEAEHPDVTVVIPTRDRPDLLRQAVDAVVAQEYAGRVHVLVVFDGTSPDPGLERQGEQRRVTTTTNVRSPGLAGGRNTGLEAATTELVAFCDDDDVWHPLRLARQTALLTTRPDAVMATCGIRVRYADVSVDRRLEAEAVLHADLLRSRLTELHPSTFLMRREPLLREVGLVDEAIPGSYAEDYDFLLRVARVAPLANVPDALVDVRWHERSFFEGRWRTIVEALEWLLRRHPEFHGERRGHARVLGQIAFAEAAQGHRRAAVGRAVQTLLRWPLEPRAALAVAVASGAASPERVLRALHRRGKGV